MPIEAVRRCHGHTTETTQICALLADKVADGEIRASCRRRTTQRRAQGVPNGVDATRCIHLDTALVDDQTLGTRVTGFAGYFRLRSPDTTRGAAHPGLSAFAVMSEGVRTATAGNRSCGSTPGDSLVRTKTCHRPPPASRGCRWTRLIAGLGPMVMGTERS